MRISVGLKVFSIAIISLVMMASTGLYSVWKLHEVARESDVVAKVYLALVESAGDIDKHVLEQEILIERMRLLTRVPYQEGERAAQIEAALLAFDTRGEQAGVAIKVAGRLLDYAVTRDPSVESAYEASTIRAHLQQVDRERMDFTRHARRLVGFALEGREDARAAFAEMLDEQEGEFDRSVAELRQRVTSFAHGAAEQARDDAADLERHSLILILIATTVGLLLSAVVSIGLIRPMRRLLMGIRDVRGGDLDTHVAVRSRDEVGELSTGFNEMTAGLKAKEQIKSIFGNYLDPRIVDQLIARPDLTEPGGDRRDMTIFFSDIAGFTQISETLTASALVDLINAYLTAMSGPIEAENGVVDKFIGDAIMAFWGPPFVRDNEQAVRACRAALASLKVLDEFQLQIPEITGMRSDPPRVDIRIGIATGSALVGNVGSATKKNYTLMGDTVNLAARLEGACKQYGLRILVSQNCRELAGSEILAREIDSIAVKGKNETIRIFEPRCLSVDATEVETDLCSAYEAALRSYRTRDWGAAEGAFQQLAAQHDPVSATMLERVRLMQANPPEEDWDGVWRMIAK